MISLLLFVLMGTRTIHLEAEILTVSPSLVEMQFDGTILLGDGKKLYHFSNTGQLIRKIDGAVEGPGAIPFLDSAVFDGNHYLIQDINQGEVHIFARDGSFLSQQPLQARLLLSAQQALFMIDLDVYRKVSADDRVLVHLTVAEDGKLAQGERFYPIRKLTEELLFNFKHHTISQKGDAYYVMDDLSPEIAQFSPAFQRVATVTAQLPDYVPPKCCFPVGNFDKVRAYMTSQSYITLLMPYEQGFAVAYSLPDPNTPEAMLYRIQPIDPDGKALGPFMPYTGKLIGCFKDAFYFLRESTGRWKEVEIWSK